MIQTLCRNLTQHTDLGKIFFRIGQSVVENESEEQNLLIQNVLNATKDDKK